MSASREKNSRKESVLTQNTQAARKTKAANENRSFYTKVIVAVVALAIAFVVCFIYGNENVRKNMTAVTVDGEKFTATELDYYYHTAVNQHGSYLSYLGVDPNQDLDAQKYSEDMTWGDYFRDEAVASLSEIASVYQDAMENGFEITPELQKEIDEFSASIDEYCKSNSITREQFLQGNYGSHMTNDIYMKHLTMMFVASEYASQHQENTVYTDDELNAYYNEHKNDIDLASYEVLSVKPDYTGIEGTTEGSADETPTYTEEQDAQAMEAAKATAEAYLERVNNGEKLSDIGDEYNTNSYSNKEDVSYATFVGYTFNDWVFDEARTIGDTGIVEDAEQGFWYVVVLNDRYRPDYNTVDVRHILLKPVDSSLKPGDEGYEAALEVNMAYAKNQAQEVLNKYLAGEHTAEAFGELAKTNSADSSASAGGLITGISKGEMVEPFENWCFDSSRKVGDTGIVESTYGYHVMYFDGVNEPYWEVRSTRAMDAEWLQNIYDSAKVKQHTLGYKAIH